MLRDLRGIRPPLFKMGELEAMLKQAAHIAGNRAVLLDHPRRKPVSHARAFTQIIIERPYRRAARICLPGWIAGRGEDRVLDRKDEISPWSEQALNGRADRSKGLDVVERQRAIDQIEGGIGKLKLLDVPLEVGHRRVVRLGAR